MNVTWLATFHDPDPALKISKSELDWVVDVVRSTPGLSRGLVFTPWEISGLYHDDGPAPQLVLQLYFETVEVLEENLTTSGHLQALAQSARLPSLARAEVTEQAMLVRRFAVPDAELRTTPGEPFCTYLVHYPGPADDLNVWLRHYLDHHAPVMQSFPEIRALEVCSRLDWCSALPWRRVNHMQRNKVVFDDAAALRAALASPAMQDMRADFENFPAFSGGNAHYPMATLQVDPG